MAVRVETSEVGLPSGLSDKHLEVVSQPELKRFGKEWPVEFLPLNQINVCGQQRREFDEESLETLGNSIEQEGQLHDLVVFRFAPELAQRYVELTNECWGTNVDFSIFYQRDDGFFDILDAGERRLRSMIKKEADLGDPPGTYGVNCKVRFATVFAEVIKIQFDENLHEAVPSEQGAKSLRQAYFIGKKEGLFNSVQDFIKFCSLREDTTRKALAYFELPTQVRGLVEEGDLSYSMATEFVPLMRAAYEYYTRILLQSDDVDGQLQLVSVEQVVASAQSKVLTEAEIVARRLKTDDKEDRLTTSQARKYISGVTKALNSQLSFDEMTLLTAGGIERDQQLSKDRRLASIAKMAEDILRLYHYLRENGVEIDTSLLPDIDPVSEEQ